MKPNNATRHRELVAVFAALSAESGFVADIERGDERGWLTWIWAKEPHAPLIQRVELLVKKPALNEAMANQLVYLRNNGEDILVDGRTIPELDRIEIGSGILGSLLWKLARKRIARDLRDSLSWFRHFSSISACIDRIESGESNLGSGEAATRVLQLLRDRQAMRVN